MLRKELYKIGEKLELNKNEIECILKYELKSEEQVDLSNGGPGGYHGALYGVICINDF
jgi:hypothetical protein